MLDFIDLALQSLAQVADATASAAAEGAVAGLSPPAVDAAAATDTVAGSLPAAHGALDAATALAGSAAFTGAPLQSDAGQATGFLHFISQSDIVGKSLFGVLILMSLISWYLIVVK